VVPAAVANGLRAVLQSGNLLTGSLVIGLEFFPEAEPLALGEYAGHPEIPTRPGGLQRLEQQIGALLEKINGLPLESVARSLDAGLHRLDGTLATATATLQGVNTLVMQDSTQELPAELVATLSELRRVLAGYSAESPLYDEIHSAAFEIKETLTTLEALTRTLEAQPNAIIFGRKPEVDPEPKVSR
jgi:paraquat-inducible protein B